MLPFPSLPKQTNAVDKLLMNQGKCITETLKICQITWVATNPVRIYLRKLTCISCNIGNINETNFSIPKTDGEDVPVTKTAEPNLTELKCMRLIIL